MAHSGVHYGGENDGEVDGENYSGNAVNNDSNGDRLAYSVVTHSAGLVICQGISHLLVATPPAPPPPCIENRGIEDNFIFYIEYCFFFVPGENTIF